MEYGSDGEGGGSDCPTDVDAYFFLPLPDISV